MVHSMPNYIFTIPLFEVTCHTSEIAQRGPGLGSQIGTLPTSFHAYATLQPYSLLRRGYTSYDAAPIWTSSLL